MIVSGGYVMSSRLEQAIDRLDRAVGAVEAVKAADSAAADSKGDLGVNLGGEIAEIRKLIDDAMEILTPNHEDKPDGK